jgi:hypothetical protein
MHRLNLKIHLSDSVYLFFVLCIFYIGILLTKISWQLGHITFILIIFYLYAENMKIFSWSLTLKKWKCNKDQDQQKKHRWENTGFLILVSLVSLTRSHFSLVGQINCIYEIIKSLLMLSKQLSDSRVPK